MLPNGVMNAEDVARYLHLGKNTVYQLAKTGQLASYHVGRKLRFTLEDVEAYVASTRQSSEGAILQPPFSKPTPQTQAAQSAKPVSQSGAQSISDAAAFGKLPGNAFVLAGGDAMADLIASNLNASGMPVTRLVRGSYTALVNLYAGDADAAVVHLYDQRANSYNIPYVRSLAPGASVVVFRLYGRRVGFIVQAGNPKGLTTWGSLLRDGVQLPIACDPDLTFQLGETAGVDVDPAQLHLLDQFKLPHAARLAKLLNVGSADVFGAVRLDSRFHRPSNSLIKPSLLALKNYIWHFPINGAE